MIPLFFNIYKLASTIQPTYSFTSKTLIHIHTIFLYREGTQAFGYISKIDVAFQFWEIFTLNPLFIPYQNIIDKRLFFFFF